MIAFTKFNGYFRKINLKSFRVLILIFIILVFVCIVCIYKTPIFIVNSTINVMNKSAIIACPPISPNLLGRVPVRNENISMKEIESELWQVLPGGVHSPEQCVASEKVAIIFPLRNRERHLNIMIRYLHPFLIRQQRDYKIYAIEQTNEGEFNRGKLFNIGFKYGLRDGYKCFIFHDVDLLPEDDRNIYECYSQPTHYSGYIDSHNYSLLYKRNCGGVIAFTDKQFKKINGFSNNYKGWGAEDDDLYRRIIISGMKLNRKSKQLGRYKALNHTSNAVPVIRVKNSAVLGISFVKYILFSSYLKDGVNNLDYKVIDYNVYKLYTRILVNV